MPRAVDYEKLAAFVEARRKATGGYGATRQLPATVEDTDEAVELLGIIADRASVATPAQGDGELAGYLTRVRNYAAAALRRGAPSLATSYHVARLVVEVLGVRPETLLGSAPALDLPARCAVDHVRMHVAVSALLGQNVAADALIPWLQRSQNGDGGFGFYPGTTSFIENCHAALAALALLGTQPAEPATAAAFIVSSQTGAGGFARNPGAAPFLDASWHAIRSLQLLESMSSRL